MWSAQPPYLITHMCCSPLLLASLQIRRHSQFCLLTSYEALAEIEEMNV